MLAPVNKPLNKVNTVSNASSKTLMAMDTTIIILVMRRVLFLVGNSVFFNSPAMLLIKLKNLPGTDKTFFITCIDKSLKVSVKH